MDARVYMLAGTFALLVIALIGTVVSLIHAARSGRGAKARPVTPAEKPRVELPASILVAPSAAPVPQPEPAPPAPQPEAPVAEPVVMAPLPAAAIAEAEPASEQAPAAVEAAAGFENPSEPLIVPATPEPAPEPVETPTDLPEGAAAPERDSDLDAWMSTLPQIELPVDQPAEPPADQPAEETDPSAGLLALHALLEEPEPDADASVAEAYAPVTEALPAQPEALAFLGFSEELLDGPAAQHPVSVGPDGLVAEPDGPVEPEIDTTSLLSAAADDTREPGEIAAAALRWLESQAALDAQAEAAAQADADKAIAVALAAEPLVETPEPVLGMVPELALELLVEPVYEPASAYAPAVLPLPELILEPPAPAPLPGPAPVWLPPTLSGSEAAASAAAEPEADADAFWQTLLRNQQDLPSILSAEAPAPVPLAPGVPADAISPGPLSGPPAPDIPVVLAAPTERPPVVVHSADVDLPSEPNAPQVIAASRPARPRAVVRLTGDLHVAPPAAMSAAVGPVGSAPLGDRGAAPDMTMAAPVEIWFGDYRVGVKAGTKTYEQFRRYADVLLEDLRNSTD